jgi:multiple sugar transport system ATP-binding protein
MATVSAIEISKTIGTTPVLNGVSLDVRNGEFLTLVGPSGCGKSTLLRIIAGLEPQTSGSIAIAGNVVDKIRPKLRNVAMVFQSYALYPYMTAGQNIALPLIMRKLAWWQRLPLLGRWMPGARRTLSEIDSEVREVAASLGLEALLARKPSQMSGGQRQRVALGRALVRHPHVFLMDEPLSNLDAKLRVQMREEITGLHRRLGATFIYVTHDQAEAMTMSDRVAVMRHGEILQLATPQVIYSDPDTIEVAKFIGSPQINLLPAIVDDRLDLQVHGTRITGLFTKLLSPDMRLTIGLRPEAIRFSLDDRDDGLPACVSYVESLGSDSFIHAKLDDQKTPVIVRAIPGAAGQLRPGAQIRLSFSLGDVLIFGADGKRIRAGARLAEMKKAYA